MEEKLCDSSDVWLGCGRMKKKLRREGVEPPPTGWKPVILPLNYRRGSALFGWY